MDPPEPDPLNSDQLHLQVGAIIDDRERDLADAMSRRHPSLQRKIERLMLGDVQIVQDGRIALVLERKTRDDLRASLIDGRFASQRARLINEYGRERCGYVVEGGTRWSDPESGAEIALVARDRVATFWTEDVGDTSDLIARLCRSVLTSRDTPPSPNRRRVAGGDRPKSSGDNARAACSSMLQCVPGVSKRRADTISSNFGSLCGVARAIDQDRAGVERAISEMTDARSGRRFGTQVAMRIVSSLADPGSRSDAVGGPAVTPSRDRRKDELPLFTSCD